MNKDELLRQAITIIESIDFELLESNNAITPEIIDMLNQLLDDYYAEVSFLNENFSKAITNELNNYINATIVAGNLSEITVQNKDTSRTYRAKYRKEGEELIIIQPFKEII